ncbi:MAG: 3-hydroxyacyl-ACP dehydratase FabZ [Rickettsiales bacterium]|nr:3-hydroxyacyl-ACP dehydratase FabZ [Rickettsiales bacterium]
MSEDLVLDVNDIMRMIPHRYPFLLIDKMKNIVSGESAVGVKNVTINEPFFVGHFPEKPVMPGVLIIEAMAQTSGALVVHTLGDEAEGKLVYFMSVDKAKFRKPVGPGDTIEILVVKTQARRNVWKFDCVATVDGVKVAEALVQAMIMLD